MSTTQFPTELLASASHVRIETPDLDGLLRGKIVDVRKFSHAKSHIMFPEAYLSFTIAEDLTGEGIGSPDTGYGDMIIQPDWSTACKLPGRESVVTVMCDGFTKSGEEHAIHPRSVLKRVVRDAAADGFESIMGAEFEFWLFRVDEASEAALRDGRLSDLTPASRQANGYSLARWPDCAEYFDDLLAVMDALGAPIETVLTETAAGMFEAALAPQPALQAADAAARFKLVARELAAKHGLIVSFVAKLDAHQPGSSGHLHQSLLRDGVNVFWNGAQDSLSDEGRSYVAGLLQATQQCGVVMAPYPNSYRRFKREFFAPESASWGFDNRNACARAISLDEKSARFELRRPGADLQPYLTIAASLAGGVHGIREGLVAPAESTGTCEPTPGSELSTNLADAVHLFSNSRFAKEALGAGLVEAYSQLRLTELQAWQDLAASTIPDWELKRYLEVV